MLKDDARSGGMPQNASGLLAEHVVLSSLDKLKELAGLRSRRVRTFATSRPRSVRPVNRAPLVPSSPSWSPNKPTACNWDRASNLSCTPGGLLASRVSQKGRASWHIRSTGQAPIAILLVGAVRTLVEPRVAASIRTNLIDAQHVAVDVFVHLHLSQDMGTTVDGTWGHAHAIAGGTLDAADDRLRVALERLQPVGRELLENSDCAADALRQHPVCKRLEDERRRGRGSMRSPAPKAPLAGFLQYAWVARAFRALMAHEAQRHAPYEWVIRTRPDIAFFDRAPPAIMFPTQRLVLMMKESGPSYFDGLYYVPQSLLQNFTQGLEDFYAPSGGGGVNPRHLPFPPEWHFFPWLRKVKAIPWSYFPLPAVLVRKAGVADCWRLRANTRETASIVYDQQMSAWGRDEDEPTRTLSFANACERFICSCDGPESQ